MKLFSSKIVVVILCLLLSAVTASAEEILTNSSVERMVAAGLSPEIITSKIKSTKSNFDVSIDAILQLKKNGIDDGIVKAMVDAASNKILAPQKKMDPNDKLLRDIEEAAGLKEKRDYTWKTKAHAVALTLKLFTPQTPITSNTGGPTPSIPCWWKRNTTS